MIALALTLVTCVIEVIGGHLSLSLSLITDAGHMFSDFLGEILALLGLWIAERPADQRKTFGYHRIEVLMALIQGALLFGMASLVIWSAVHRLRAPPEVHTGIMLAVAAFGLLINAGCLLLLRGGSSLSVRGAYLHVLMDGLSSVAVLIVGGVLWLAPGLRILDPLLAIGIALFICYSAYRLAGDAVELLLLAVPRELDLRQVEAGLLDVPGIKQIHDLHIWTIGSGMHALSAHLVVDCAQVAESDALLTLVKQHLKQRYRITHSTLQIESDVCAGREKVC